MKLLLRVSVFCVVFGVVHGFLPPLRAQQGAVDVSLVRIQDGRDNRIPNTVSALGGGLKIDFLIGPRWTAGPVSFGFMAGVGAEFRRSAFQYFLLPNQPTPNPTLSSYTWLQTTLGAEVALRVTPHVSVVPKAR